MPIEIKMSSTIAQDSGVKMLVYAEAGIGKTALVATLPRPLLISAESGSLSLQPNNLDRIWLPTGLPYVRDIPTIEVKSMADFEEAYAVCIHPEYSQNFDSIALDSLTEMAEKCLAHFKPLNKDPRKAYGELLDSMLELIKKFRDIPGKHVYMSAKLARDKDEVTGQTLYGPGMPGAKLGPAIPYLFDEVFRYQVMLQGEGTKTRSLLTERDISSEAKDRSGKLDAYEFPHLGYVINKIKGTQ